MKFPIKNKIMFFLTITIIPLIYISSPISPLSIIDQEKTIVPLIGLTTGDIFTSIGLTAGMLGIWHFLLKKRV